MQQDPNLHPVKDPLVVGLVLDQPLQLFGQLCRAHLLPAPLRLIAQSELHVLQTQERRSFTVTRFTKADLWPPGRSRL